VKYLLSLALLAGCASAQNRHEALVQALVVHCQVEALQPLLLDPEHVDAAEVKAALKAMKDCTAVADAGPAH
jgi:hypothetical protein